MASKNKQKKSSNEEKNIDSDTSSESSDDDSNDGKYNGNEVGCFTRLSSGDSITNRFYKYFGFVPGYSSGI